MEMEPVQRKNFLQFATGCSSLPPGGLANLQPRLTVVSVPVTMVTISPYMDIQDHYISLYVYGHVISVQLVPLSRETGLYDLYDLYVTARNTIHCYTVTLYNL